MIIVKSSLPDFATGSGVATTTPSNLPAFPVRKHVVIRADSANSAAIIIGPTIVGGFRLAAGESQRIAIDDVSKLFVSAVSGSQAYSWLAA